MKQRIFYMALIVIMALAVAGCTTQASPTPQEPVIETVIVEKEVEKIITQQVEVTVEVEVMVTPTPIPKPELSTTIRVDSLSEGTGKIFEDLVVKPFAQEMGVNIQVEHGTYGAQDEWLASVKAAPGDYCIATYFSDFGLYNGVSQGLLQPFNLANIPNYANLEDQWENRVIMEGDNQAYVATVDIGMYTFVYARDKITEKPTSYAPLFDPQYAGRIALRDYGLYRILETAAYLKLDPNNLSDEDVELIFSTMEDQAELTRAYWQSSSQLDQLLANREVWMADYWFDTVTRVGEDGTNKLDQLDIGWWFPEEGGPIWAGGPVIAKGCEGTDLLTAELLLKYLLRPDVFIKYVAAQGYIPALEEDKYDKAAFFAATPHRLAYQQAILDTGILLNVANILSRQDEWLERYEELKLGQ
jgi:spermidine/putrescine-binding protein